MVYNEGKLWYITVMIVICSSYTYGELWQSSPDIPKKEVLKTCAEWMEHHGFVNGFEKNMSMAHKRAKKFDHEVYVYAATYAYFLSSFLPPHLYQQQNYPSQFCQRFPNPKTGVPYLALKDAEMTCGEWILAYGYHQNNARPNHVTGQYRYNTGLNYNMAYYRYTEHDADTHIWVVMYSRYMMKSNKENLDPLEFCMKMGQHVIHKPQKLPFVKLETTKLCEEWIKLSDYTDDTDQNIQMALLQDLEFLEYLSKWTADYINYLLNFEKENSKAGHFGCCGTSKGPKPNTPANFCKTETSGQPVHYHPS